MKQVGQWIAEALNNRNDASTLGRIRRDVVQLADAFPLCAERREKAQAGV